MQVVLVTIVTVSVLWMTEVFFTKVDEEDGVEINFGPLRLEVYPKEKGGLTTRWVIRTAVVAIMVICLASVFNPA